MLNAMELRANFGWGQLESRCQILPNSSELPHDLDSLESKSRHAQCITELCSDSCPRVAWYGDVIDVPQLGADLIEAELNRLTRETSGGVDAVQGFVLR